MNGQFHHYPEGISETAKFELSEGVRVITDDDRIVEPGSGEMGKIATSGRPRVLQRRRKIAATFVLLTVFVIASGDYATVEADGSITLLGRGSACINTAGEKVFPEEVEEAVKRFEPVHDCLWQCA